MSCVGTPCVSSVTEEQKCFDGWSDWRSDISPANAVGFFSIQNVRLFVSLHKQINQQPQTLTNV